MTQSIQTGNNESQFPKVYGRYLLINLLNRGGMGEVYLAKTGQISGFEKIVVIKKILPSLSSNINFSKKFISEAQIAIKLNHVNIVPVLEVGRIQGEFFIAMDYVEGMDLRRIMSKLYTLKTPLKTEFALLIARDLLTGLSYAHRRVDEDGSPLEIVHCDISPPNILVSYEGEVKVIDFGVAKSVLATEEESSHLGFGKFGYMAPEQIIKGKEVDARTDIYSSGVVLWELLTGTKMLTFSPTTPFKEIAKKVVLEPPIPPSQINPKLDKRFDTLVLKAIEKDPEKRYQTAAEFRNEVQKLLAKINPTLTNDDLGEFIRNLFKTEIENQRKLIKEAKAVDIHEFEDELTQAMEQTVSFAVGNEFPGGAVGDLVMLPMTTQGRTTPSGILTQKVQLFSLQNKKFLIATTVALVILAAFIWSIILFENDTPKIKINSFFELSQLPTIHINASQLKNKTIVQKTDTQNKDLQHITKPSKKANKHARLQKKSWRKKTIKKYKQYATKKYATKPMAPTRAPSLKTQNTAKLKSQLKSLYYSVNRKLKKFKETHGDILNKEWVPLKIRVITAIRTNKTAEEYIQLINRLKRFRNKMNQF